MFLEMSCYCGKQQQLVIEYYISVIYRIKYGSSDDDNDDDDDHDVDDDGRNVYSM